MFNPNICAFVSTRGLCIAPDVAATAHHQKNQSQNYLAPQPKPLFFERALNNSDNHLAVNQPYGGNKFILPRRKHASESSSESSEASSASNSPLSSTDNLNESSDSYKKPNYDLNDLSDAENADSMFLDFQCSLSAEKQVQWRTLFINNILFVDVPASVLPEGSRDSFVSLLEYAEEKLECDKVYVCFKRNRVDRAALMRVFMFLGFTIVPPGNKDVPQNEDVMAMVYNID